MESASRTMPAVLSTSISESGVQRSKYAALAKVQAGVHSIG